MMNVFDPFIRDIFDDSLGQSSMGSRSRGLQGGSLAPYSNVDIFESDNIYCLCAGLNIHGIASAFDTVS